MARSFPSFLGRIKFSRSVETLSDLLINVGDVKPGKVFPCLTFFLCYHGLNLLHFAMSQCSPTSVTREKFFFSFSAVLA
jgi:hypothetical protein